MRAHREAILLTSFAGISPELMLDPNMSSVWRLVTAMFVRGQSVKNYPVCLAAKRACPPEDCGGLWGYSDFLEAISNPEDEQDGVRQRVLPRFARTPHLTSPAPTRCIFAPAQREQDTWGEEPIRGRTGELSAERTARFSAKKGRPLAGRPFS